MEWDLDKYNDREPQSARPAAPSRGTGPDNRSIRPKASRTAQKKRRSVSLPPWVLVLLSLLFYCFCFHVWTENHFSVGRFLTVTLLSLGFAMLTALLATIGKKRKLHKSLGLAVVIFWAVVFLTEMVIC